VIPDGIEDEKVLFLSDTLPTGWMAAANCEIKPEEVVAVWGCGPVGLFAIQSALALGAHRVIAIDHYPHRLDLAKLVEMTGGIGPDACIDAVGMESHGFTADSVMEKVKAAVKLVMDQTHGLRQVIIACRKGGRTQELVFRFFIGGCIVSLFAMIAGAAAFLLYAMGRDTAR
jgi:threonine dehydrogenase-like Zn-dependent dehydrogenase